MEKRLMQIFLDEEIYEKFSIFCREMNMPRSTVVAAMVGVVTGSDIKVDNSLRTLLKYNKPLYLDIETLAAQLKVEPERVVESILQMYVRGELIQAG